MFKKKLKQYSKHCMMNPRVNETPGEIVETSYVTYTGRRIFLPKSVQK